MSEDETVHQYSTKLQDLVNQIRANGGEFLDKRVVEKIMVSVLDKFESKLSTIEETCDLDTMTVNELISKLKAHEQRLTLKGQVVATKGAFQARQKGKQYKGKQQVQCHACKKFGHKEKSYKAKKGQYRPKQSQQANYSDDQQGEDHLFLAVQGSSTSSKDCWYMNSDCTSHMVKNEDYFIEIDKSVKTKVKLSNGSMVRAQGKGTIAVQTPLEWLQIKTLRSDNGNEYTSSEFNKFCEDAGIGHQLTVPYSPQQNGVLERKNRTVMEIARCMLHEKRLPKSFWAKAVYTAIYLLNSLPAKAVKGKTPVEAWYGIKPSANHLKVFGSMCYNHVPDIKRTKLDQKANVGIFVGYATQSKSYRVYDVHSKKKDEVDGNKTANSNLNGRIADTDDDSPILKTKSLEEIYEQCSFIVDEPSNYAEASKHEEWRNAMQEELTAIEKNGIPLNVWGPKFFASMGSSWGKFICLDDSTSQRRRFDIARFLISTPVMNSISVMRQIKIDGSVYKLKFTEEEFTNSFFSLKQDFIPHFSSDSEEQETWSMDSEKEDSASKGAGEEEQGKDGAAENEEDDDDVAYSKGESYDSDLRIGYAKSKSDIEMENSRERKAALPCSEDEQQQEDKGEPSGQDRASASEQVHICMQRSKEGVIQRKKKIRLCSSVYLKARKTGEGIQSGKRRERQKMKVEKGQGEPNFMVSPGGEVVGESNLKLSKDDDSLKCNASFYKSLIESLLYLTTTRLDLMFAASLLSRYMTSPSQTHFSAAKRALRYVNGTVDYGIMYKSASDGSLQGYVDSDWVGCPNDSKSTTGYVFSFGSGMFCWNSSKQEPVAQSMAEAEYIDVGATSNHAIWLRKILNDIGQPQVLPCVIQIDNKLAIAIAKNLVQHGRTKHIHVKYHVIRQYVKEKKIKLLHYDSEVQAVDILTTSLPKSRFETLRSMLGLTKKPLKEEC
ncbi:hypothetical protein SLEP1_g55260 [Rubroshorea leprosula]|uniref:Integrase catalytic domain-containing protein n=1 Tax=Rubroshorea leprosula TaxID=152421 RepID=A0AAV5MJ09_9ROSI|nr:hypothetical protein SLEP1_g55260 [Rubroshorea leprosula]